jgi:elongation factor G
MVTVERIRNVVLVGHHGSGKTSLAEALLFRAGAIERMGRIDNGTTVGDTDDDEREREQSLALAVSCFDWGDHRINLIDAPGDPDFRGDALMAMGVADLAVFVVDGVAGVQVQDRVLWRHAESLQLPRLVFVNKLDREHSSFDRVLQDVRSAFGSHTDPIELPIGEESSFHGLADVLTDQAFFYDTGSKVGVEMPEALAGAERAEHEHLVEDVIERDDQLLEGYLEGNEPPVEEVERLLHEAVDDATIFPVLCGSATTPIGADALAEFICRVGPAPGDRGPMAARDGDREVELLPDAEGATVVVVFKTMIDEFVGQISFFRVVSGTIRADEHLVNGRSRDKERFHQLVSPLGTSHRAVSSLGAGDIGAVTKLGETRTGDTLSESGDVVVVTPRLPSPVYGVAIAAASQADEDRLATTLRRLMIEDPTLHLEHDDSTNQTVLRGGGENHVRVALARAQRAGVEVVVDDVKVAYRETLAGSVETEGKYKKQTGGHGQFGVASVRFEPLPRGGGYEFDSEVTGGAIPRNLIPAVGAGIEEAMSTGGVYGYPLVDIRAVCTNGRYHSVDSSEMSFKIAGSLALREAIAAVGVEVLEPISAMRVQVPSEHQGDVLGDLNSRRAQVQYTETDEAGMTMIQALVPTSEILRYAIDLRALTGGAGTFGTDHHGYQSLAPHLVERAGLRPRD